MTGDDRVPVTRPAGDIHPKVAAGGVVGLIALIVTYAVAAWAPDLPVDENVAFGIAGAVVYAAQLAGSYVKRSYRTRGAR